MASGTFTLATTGENIFTFRIYWTSTANTANNTSTVNVYIQGKVNDSYGQSSAQYVALGNGNTSIVAHYLGGSNIKEYFPGDATANLVKGYYNYIAGTSFTVSHASDGTRSIGLIINVNGYLVKGPTCGGWGKPTITLDRIPQSAQITAAPNFTDEQNPTITFSNPAGEDATLLQACISLDGGEDDVKYRDIIPKTSTSYTFNLTEAERNVLRNATLDGSNTRTVRFYVKSTINGTTHFNFVDKIFTVTNAEPELGAIIMDTNDTTAALTGDRLVSLIKGYSNVSYEMSATALKGASIESYKATNGSNTKTTSSGTFNAVTDSKFTLSTTDNRGLTTKKEFTLNLIDYFKPTCSQKATIVMDDATSTSAKVTLVVSGKWCSRHFGAAHNALNVEYRYKQEDGAWSAWSGTNYITDKDSYEVTFTIKNLDYTQACTLQSRAVDSLDSAVSAEYTLKLNPVFDWSKEDFKFNVPVTIKGDVTIDGNLIMNGEESGGPADYIIEQGTEAMGTNGTWYWEKWKNGKAVCYGVRNFGNMSVSSAWGSFYEAGPFSQNFPSDLFIAAPDVIDIDIRNTSAGAFLEYASSADLSSTRTGNFYIARASSGTLSAVHLCFHIIGKWK